jgi:hypothetical protein
MDLRVFRAKQPKHPAISVLLAGIRTPAWEGPRVMTTGSRLLSQCARIDRSLRPVRFTSGNRGPGIAKGVPPTPTPASTPTIDPTLAAAFIPVEEATRLPTFTAAPPLAVPTFVEDAGAAGRIPVGLLIMGFAVVGVLGTMVSFLRGR